MGNDTNKRYSKSQVIYSPMNVFSARSIGLYTLAIGSAIGFFHLVTSYGEAHLKAPISVAGNYLIANRDLPGCLQHKTLLFNIHQSGIYLNASIIAIDVANTDIPEITGRSATTSTPEIRPTFSGRLHEDRQLDLSGSLLVPGCPVPSQLRIAGSLAKPLPGKITTGSPSTDGQLQGKLWLTNKDRPQGSPVDFTATIQTSSKATQSH
jgi:hypothetical protein